VVKVKKENRDAIKVMVVISILIFAGMSLASNGDESLLTQAKQIFAPLPQVIVSDKNPVKTEKVLAPLHFSTSQ